VPRPHGRKLPPLLAAAAADQCPRADPAVVEAEAEEVGREIEEEVSQMNYLGRRRQAVRKASVMKIQRTP
jgi:hypothetical protein